jgi:hypothetical protein
MDLNLTHQPYQAVLSAKQKSEILQSIAGACAVMQRRGCRRKGCADCQYNINHPLYNDDKFLIQTQAVIQNDIYNRHNARQAGHLVGSWIGTVVSVVTIIVLAVLVVMQCVRATPSYTPVSYTEKQIGYKVLAIRETMADRWIDINKDGKVDCVDRAVIFYALWCQAGFGSDSIQLVYNSNVHNEPHLFIGILSNSGWIYAEPNDKYGQRWKDSQCWTVYDRSKNEVYDNICDLDNDYRQLLEKELDRDMWRVYGTTVSMRARTKELYDGRY